MLDFYQSPEFRAYRRKVIKAAVDYMRPRIETKDPNDFWKAQGAIEMARKVVSIPTDDHPKNENLQQYAREDMDTFFASLIRQNLE